MESITSFRETHTFHLVPAKLSSRKPERLRAGFAGCLRWRPACGGMCESYGSLRIFFSGNRIMKIQASGADWKLAAGDWLVVPVPETSIWPENLKAVDAGLEGLLTRLREQGDLTGKLAEVSKIFEPPQIAAKRLLCIGVGSLDELTAAKWNLACMTAARAISDKANVAVRIMPPTAKTENLSEAKILEIAARAFTVGCVGQGLYQRETAACVCFRGCSLPGNGGKPTGRGMRAHRRAGHQSHPRIRQPGRRKTSSRKPSPNGRATWPRS